MKGFRTCHISPPTPKHTAKRLPGYHKPHPRPSYRIRLILPSGQAFVIHFPTIWRQFAESDQLVWLISQDAKESHHRRVEIVDGFDFCRSLGEEYGATAKEWFNVFAVFGDVWQDLVFQLSLATEPTNWRSQCRHVPSLSGRFHPFTLRCICNLRASIGKISGIRLKFLLDFLFLLGCQVRLVHRVECVTNQQL